MLIYRLLKIKKMLLFNKKDNLFRKDNLIFNSNADNGNFKFNSKDRSKDIDDYKNYME